MSEEVEEHRVSLPAEVMNAILVNLYAQPYSQVADLIHAIKTTADPPPGS